MTENTAMNSGVVENSNGRVKFPIMEPAPGKRSSQIEEYLEFHHGPGAQHIALLSGDIIQTIRALRTNGIDFLYTPDTYYETLEERVGNWTWTSSRFVSWVFSSIRTSGGRCFRSSPNLCTLARLRSWRLFSAKAHAASAAEISKRCLKRLNVSRRCAETYRRQGEPASGGKAAVFDPNVCAKQQQAELARLGARVERSALQKMLVAASRPGIISFALGMPAVELFPTEALAEAAERVLSANAVALQYSPPLQSLKQHVRS